MLPHLCLFSSGKLAILCAASVAAVRSRIRGSCTPVLPRLRQPSLPLGVEVLSRRQRQVLTLRHTEGLPYKLIADRLHIATDTARLYASFRALPPGIAASAYDPGTGVLTLSGLFAVWLGAMGGPYQQWSMVLRGNRAVGRLRVGGGQLNSEYGAPLRIGIHADPAVMFFDDRFGN